MAKKRGNNEGSITRRKDGLWMAQVTLGRDPQTGKLKRATFYGKTRQEVADKLTKALREKQQGTFVTPHKTTLGVWLDIWLWEYKKPRLRPITHIPHPLGWRSAYFPTGIWSAHSPSQP